VEKLCTAGQAIDDNIIWRMLIAYCIPKATNTDTRSLCVILIAFTHQQLLHERASMLGYTYIGCLIYSYVELLIVIFIFT
jgi:hypothetical protein